jgi:hypothetical protein
MAKSWEPWMTNGENERFDVEEKPEWSPVKWAFDIWTWILILAAGVAFEVFADPLLAGLVVCLKFGWSDARAGYQTAKDPCYRRGVMLRNLYIGRACLKVAFAGAVTAIGITVGEFALGMNFNPWRLLVGWLLTYSGFFFGTLLILAGAAGINQGYFCPWMDELSYSQATQFPPRRFGATNRVPRVFFGGMAAAFVAMLPPFGGFLEANGPMRFDQIAVGIILAIVLLLLWLWIIWQMLRAMRKVAARPEECWPELIG